MVDLLKAASACSTPGPERNHVGRRRRSACGRRSGHAAGRRGNGEIAFGALQAGLDLAYGHEDVVFDWEGDDDMHEVWGSGSAELVEDGSLEVEFDCHRGDNAVLNAVSDAASTAC